jgi:uncharacterized protein YkwD
MLQLINEARMNPAAAATQLSRDVTPQVAATLNFYGVNLQAAASKIASAAPLPPVAWDSSLASAAQGQSQYMADNQIQSHSGVGGSTAEQRMTAAGYTNIKSSAENAYAYSSSPEEAMQAFLFDWGVPSDGHRINIQQPGVSAQDSYRDVGIGLVQTDPSNPAFGPMVITQDFGSRPNSQAQLVGVAYNDQSNTKFYQPGEGQGGLQIDAVNLQTGNVLSTQTWDSGGYKLSLPAGRYRVIASLNGQVVQTTDINVGDLNVEQDFILTNSWQGGSRDSAIAAAQPQLAPPVVTIPRSTPQPAAPPAASPQSSVVSWLAGSWSSAWNATVR